MKCIIALVFLAALVLAGQATYCDSDAPCGEGMCCTGSSYNRHCQLLSEDGTPCQKENKYGAYSFGCPCKEGLICSPINYCQPE